MNKKNWTLGVTLFSMFFGAGNLIFAPFMGAQAGSRTPLTLIGFLVAAVILPITAIVTIAPYGSAKNMISRIYKPLGPIFVTLIYLLIGPCIAIPRTASTSYEMWTWLISDNLAARILYILVFFGAAMVLAFHPGKLKDILGKILGPILLVLVAFVALPALFHPGLIAYPASGWASSPLLKGLNEGYQTMDILAAFCFGLIFMLNIQQAKVKNEKKTFLVSACIAGGLLAVVYTLLSISSMLQSASLQSCSNGAEVLSVMAGETWGNWGQLLCGLIFLIACINVCAGLLASCSEYFSLLFPKVAYRAWLILFALAGAIMACFGLQSILSWSGTLLSWICPIAILFLVTGWIKRPKTGKSFAAVTGTGKTAKSASIKKD